MGTMMLDGKKGNITKAVALCFISLFLLSGIASTQMNRNPVKPAKPPLVIEPSRLDVAAYQDGRYLVVYFTPYDEDDRPLSYIGTVRIYCVNPDLAGPYFSINGGIGALVLDKRIITKDYKLKKIGVLGEVRKVCVFRIDLAEMFKIVMFDEFGVDTYKVTLEFWAPNAKKPVVQWTTALLDNR